MAQYIVIGGGVIGLSLVAELSKKIINENDVIVLITPEDLHNPLNNNYNNDKVIALSDINYEFLLNLGLNLTPSKVETIRMLDDGSFCEFHAHNVGLSCLGYCVSWQEIYTQLCSQICQLKNVDIVKAKVHNIEEIQQNYPKYKHIFLCDGGNIQLPQIKYIEHDYHQYMLICRGKSNNYTKATAYEFFTPYGALAVLPYEEEVICLFSMLNQQAQECINNPSVLHEIIKQYTAKQIDIKFSNNSIAKYPLKLRYVENNPYPNITVLGNAAHTIHPIMAQGLNLGLKNLQLLIKTMQYEGVTAYEKYKNASKINIIQTTKFTHYLALYSKNNLRFKPFGMIKKALWGFANQLHPMQKIVFGFLQH